jgi:hypothetical protein
MLRHRCGRGALQSPIYLEGPLYSAMRVSLGREPLTSLQSKDFYRKELRRRSYGCRRLLRSGLL